MQRPTSERLRVFQKVSLPPCQWFLFLGSGALILIMARSAAKDNAMVVVREGCVEGSTAPPPPATNVRDPPNRNNHNVVKAVVKLATVEALSLTKTEGGGGGMRHTSQQMRLCVTLPLGMLLMGKGGSYMVLCCHQRLQRRCR